MSPARPVPLHPDIRLPRFEVDGYRGRLRFALLQAGFVQSTGRVPNHVIFTRHTVTIRIDARYGVEDTDIEIGPAPADATPDDRLWWVTFSHQTPDEIIAAVVSLAAADEIRRHQSS